MANQTTYELVVEPRQIIGKQTRQLRREELVPATVYGHNVAPESVQVPQRDLDRVYLRAGSNTLIDLKIGDGTKSRKVFIHSVQRHPVTHVVRHVDFMVVNLLEEMTMTVPLVLVGEAPAVANGEGLLLHALDHVQIRALPTDILPMLEVDVSSLDAVDAAIHVSDLNIPQNVTLLTHGDELVAKITNLPVEEAPEVEEAAEGEEAGAAGEDQDAGGNSSDES